MINTVKKNQIDLSNYPYKVDIENRLQIAELSAFEVELLQEIVDSSLCVPIKSLSATLDVQEELLRSALSRLEKTRLFKISQDYILVDKDVRRYYETEISKFDSSFQPGIEYVKSLLKKVPIEYLPTWYALPRTSDDIFQAITEKYLLTPKIFMKHVSELAHEMPIVASILKDLENSENLQLPSTYFCDKYNYSKTEFEELMLLLEFNFICCISYARVEDDWIEIVTPFTEWKEYLRFLNTTKAKESIKLKKELSTFNFIKQLKQTLKQTKSKCIPLQELDEKVLTRLQQMHLVDVKNDSIVPLHDADTFLTLREDQQAHYLYRLPLHAHGYTPQLCSDKNLREIEKHTGRFAHAGWVSFETFLTVCTAGIGTQTEVMLKKIGRQWGYVRPKYTLEEQLFIKRVIFEKFFEAGLVDVSLEPGKECFCVTPFGQKILGSD